MNRVSLGLLLACTAWVFWPQGAAAQCEGGTSTAGYYLRNGSYVPGGCAYTNSTTPGQLYPSGAQPLPSTNPVAGTSALPGQPLGTGLLPVTSGDLGQPSAGGGQTQTLGPGSPGTGPVITLPGTLGGVNALPGQVTATGVPLVNTANVGGSLGVRGVSNGLTNTVNNGTTLGLGTPNINGFASGAYSDGGLGVGGVVNPATGLGTSGLINGVTGTEGLPPTTSTGVLSGISGAPNVILPGVPGGAGLLWRDTAYGYSLPAAPPVSAQAVTPTAPRTVESPPTPGRGGPTYIGEEGPDGIIISLPHQ